MLREMPVAVEAGVKGSEIIHVIRGGGGGL